MERCLDTLREKAELGNKDYLIPVSLVRQGAFESVPEGVGWDLGQGRGRKGRRVWSGVADPCRKLPGKEGAYMCVLYPCAKGSSQAGVLGLGL